jgi:hypothetical protein
VDPYSPYLLEDGTVTLEEFRRLRAKPEVVYVFWHATPELDAA